MVITWYDRISNFTRANGRKPTMDELLEIAQIHEMTPAEVEAQRQSFARGLTARCEHGELDLNSAASAAVVGNHRASEEEYNEA